MKIKNAHLLFPFFLLAFVFSLNAQSPNNSYTVSEGDWLSKIAEKAYGNAHHYFKIIEGTNEKALTNNSYKKIGAANSISVGQKLWIPAGNSNANTTSTSTSNANSTAAKGDGKGEANLVNVPKTNCEIRIWYNYQVVAIGEINKKWTEDGVDLKTRAHQAYKLRHNARINARYLMQNKDEVKALQARDMEKYGNPDGPTFEYLMKKNTDKGLSDDEAYQSVIDSSSRTSPVYNSECE